MKNFNFVLVLLCLTAQGNAQENGAFEQRMHDIYKQSYSEEVSDERWAGYISGIGNRTYQVRGGDTLWDLSVVFFGDGLFWSKIWSYNSSLTNPHSLNVGQKINFFTGSVDEAPGISVEPEDGALATPPVLSESPENLPEGFKEVKGEEAIAENDVEALEGPTVDDSSDEQSEVKTPNKPIIKKSGFTKASGSLYPGAPSIPPPRILVKPVLEMLPQAFASSDSYDASKYDEKGISFDLRPPVRVNPLFVASSFLYGGQSKNYPNVGRLIEAENNERLVGLNHQIYMETKETFEIGERLTIMGKKYGFDRNGFTGDVIEYQGSVEISENIKKGLYRGLVIKSLSGIKGSPWISREPIPTFNDDYEGRPNPKKYQIIGGGNDNVSRFYGQSDVIFVAGGTSQGIRVGDIMGIYKRRDIRYPGTDIPRTPTPIGHIKVFRSEPGTATAFVISSSDVILPGDETGPPTIVEAKTTASELEDLGDIEAGLDFKTESDSSDESTLEEEMSEIE